ncbi:hypothetical protein CDD83_5888 [Cordyceps sp. RAO-2017]|nr:hypothetical protein CDD83_5888 [Cordyceps sp. RAO-2017]
MGGSDDEAERVVAETLERVVLAMLAARSRLRAGGSGTGGSAALVFSYRSATRPMSSRNEDRPRPDRLFWRTDENLVGTMAGGESRETEGAAGSLASPLCC